MLDRRRLLALAWAAAAVAGAGGAGFAASARRRWLADPFTLGVASGSPTADGVVLWTRLMPAGRFDTLHEADIAVEWEMAHDAGFTRVARRGTALASAALAHSVHVEVEGLASDRLWFYRFTCGDARSPVGRTRTLPAPDAAVARLRLAYASCQRWEHGYFTAWRHLLAEDVDCVMFLGDYIYEYPNLASAVRSFPAVGWANSLDEYRDRYALYKRDADLRAMHAACPWFVTWDDHEVQNDYAGAMPGSGGPPVADFAARRAAAYQAFYEHMPVRAASLAHGVLGVKDGADGAERRLYGHRAWGSLADLMLLDTRQYRDRQACTSGDKTGGSVVDFGDCAKWRDPARTLLGTAQEAWLDDAVRRARATWTVIGQQTAVGPRVVRAAGRADRLWNDGWDGYPAARDRLMRTLAGSPTRSPVLLGGDIHENWVGHVKADYARPEGANVGVEFCGTSITSRPSGSGKAAARLADNPHYVFADDDHRGYGICEFTPTRLVTTLRGLDDATLRDAAIRTLARFEVEPGRPELQRD